MAQNPNQQTAPSSSFPLVDQMDSREIDTVVRSLAGTLSNYLNIFKVYTDQLGDGSPISSDTSSQDSVAWETENSANLFVRVSKCDWIERVNGQDAFNFKAVRYNPNDSGVLLFDPSRNIYVQIDRHEVKSGCDANHLNHLYSGKWIGLAHSQNLENYFKDLEECIEHKG